MKYFAFFLLIVSSVCAEGPSCFFYNGNDLMELKARIHDPLFAFALKALIKEADRNLGAPPYTVTAKTSFPPSNDKHDYMSLGRYWWPKSTKKKGVIYKNRDGNTNPEIWGEAYDYNRMNKMVEEGTVLCWSYFLTGNEIYAQKASQLVRVWFLNAATRMNPNLKFAQRVPGKYSGRCQGIIECAHFPKLIDSLSLLEGSISWTDSDKKKMVAWSKKYLEWLLTSPQGIQESQSTNNHASWYDFQVIYFALYTDQPRIAKKHLLTHTLSKLRNQFTNNFKQPFELARNKPFHYSVYNLKALFHCALLAEKIGIDMWAIPTRERPTLRMALERLLPYAMFEKKWSIEDIDPLQPELLAPLLLIAARVYHEPRYLKMYHEILKDSIPSERLRLMFPKAFFE